jgi:hypothetical protein
MPEAWRFPILMLISFAVIFAVIWLVADRKNARVTPVAVAVIAAIVSAGGMAFAKLGANNGWPVALYYGVPAAVTIFLPPLWFRMKPPRAITYVALAFLSAPAIHYGALYLLGWDNYMPFLSRFG